MTGSPFRAVFAPMRSVTHAHRWLLCGLLAVGCSSSDSGDDAGPGSGSDASTNPGDQDGAGPDLDLSGCVVEVSGAVSLTLPCRPGASIDGDTGDITYGVVGSDGELVQVTAMFTVRKASVPPAPGSYTEKDFRDASVAVWSMDFAYMYTGQTMALTITSVEGTTVLHGNLEGMASPVLSPDEPPVTVRARF